MAIEKFKKLITFSKKENENEYFEYTDDPEIEEVQPRGGRRLFAFSFYGALLTLGVTFGANIIIGSGGGTGIQFGQGVTQIVNCAGPQKIRFTLRTFTKPAWAMISLLSFGATQIAPH